MRNFMHFLSVVGFLASTSAFAGVFTDEVNRDYASDPRLQRAREAVVNRQPISWETFFELNVADRENAERNAKAAFKIRRALSESLDEEIEKVSNQLEREALLEYRNALDNSFERVFEEQKELFMPKRDSYRTRELVRMSFMPESLSQKYQAKISPLTPQEYAELQEKNYAMTDEAYLDSLKEVGMTETERQDYLSNIPRACHQLSQMMVAAI